MIRLQNVADAMPGARRQVKGGSATFDLHGVMPAWPAKRDLEAVVNRVMPRSGLEMVVQGIMDHARVAERASRLEASVREMRNFGASEVAGNAEQDIARYFHDKVKRMDEEAKATLQHTGYTAEELRKMARDNVPEYNDLLAGARRMESRFGVPVARAVEAELVRTGHLDRAGLDAALRGLGPNAAAAAAAEGEAEWQNAQHGRAAVAAAAGAAGAPPWQPYEHAEPHPAAGVAAAHARAEPMPAPQTPVAQEQRAAAVGETVMREAARAGDRELQRLRRRHPDGRYDNPVDVSAASARRADATGREAKEAARARRREEALPFTPGVVNPRDVRPKLKPRLNVETGVRGRPVSDLERVAIRTGGAARAHARADRPVRRAGAGAATAGPRGRVREDGSGRYAG
jgi:hypothetical protein